MILSMIGPTIYEVTPPVLDVPPLTRPFKLAYGVGSMAEAVVYSSTTKFVMLYYNQAQYNFDTQTVYDFLKRSGLRMRFG